MNKITGLMELLGEENYDIDKQKMLENLKRLRDDIDELIKREEAK